MPTEERQDAVTTADDVIADDIGSDDVAESEGVGV